jgi:hypothetical protein
MGTYRLGDSTNWMKAEAKSICVARRDFSQRSAKRNQGWRFYCTNLVIDTPNKAHDDN